jgi:rhamnose utilization protein RhaD (predicted bifunctional aldolase and dehydrogenase)
MKSERTSNLRRTRLQDILRLSHELGGPTRELAILGEGNTSAQISANTFFVKASGSSLGTLQENDVVECRFSTVLALLDKTGLTDAQISEALLASRLDSQAKKPSIETLFHAYLLSLPDVEFVGHTHAVAVDGILCSTRAEEFATRRIVPDEIVCCDVESVFVPYTDPGVPLAQAVRRKTAGFVKKHGRAPRVVLMENHGIITLGRSVEGVLAAMLMAEKVAKIWLHAASLGGPNFLTPEHVARIGGRPDEAARRKALKL